MARRRDAQRNRARIVAAAADVFRTEGAAAPLDLVARRADVGRATLYRHFPDRPALVAAVLQRRLDQLEGFAAEHPGPDLLERLVVEICSFQVGVPGAMAEVRAARPGDVEDVVRRTQRLLADALPAADAAGAVRPGTALTDVFLVLTMVDGAIAARHRNPLPTPVDRAVELALRAIRSTDRLDAPVPRAVLPLSPDVPEAPDPADEPERADEPGGAGGADTAVEQGPASEGQTGTSES